MMRNLFVLLGLLTGCGHTLWDFARPFAADVDPLLVAAAGDLVEQDLKVAVESFGGRVDPSATQTIHFTLDPACSRPETLGYSPPEELGTIHLCMIAVGSPIVLREVVLHEFGHTLGQPDHLPCESHAIMTSNIQCTISMLGGIVGQNYQPHDRPFICAGGGIINARCT